MMINRKKRKAFEESRKIGEAMNNVGSDGNKEKSLKMNKKGIAIGEVMLLISFSFAIAFILSENFVRGDITFHDYSGGGALDIDSAGNIERAIASLGSEPAILTPGTATTGVVSGVTSIPSQTSGLLSLSPGSATDVDSFLGVAEEAAVSGVTDASLLPEAKLGIGPGGTATSATDAVSAAAAAAKAGAGGAYHGYSPFGVDALRIGKGGLIGNTPIGGFAAHLAEGAVWGFVVSGIVKMIGNAVGLDEGTVDALSSATFGGIMTYKGIAALSAEQGGLGLLGKGHWIVQNSAWIGIGVGVALFIKNYKKEKKELVRFECLPWEAPLGGSKCEECNGNDLAPCSEYRCKSLGQSCELVNPGTEEEKCVWVNKDDVSAPKINAWDEALSPTGLEYVPDNKISPPNRGFNILRKPQGCLAAFTNLEFGITTDEPAQCRVDYEIGENFDEMEYLFGETNLFLEEHTQKLKVPSPFEEGDAVPEIHNDGTYSLYVRCIDANGNGKDSAAVAFSFCVEPGPDVTQPVVEGTSIESGSPISFDADEVPIEVYVNEPANCRWSKQDKSYDVMENEMTCALESYQVNADLNYVCSDTLSGVENRVSNNFYFRCEDLSTAPGGENQMTTSHLVVLEGSEELVINKVGPEDEFSGSTSTVEVVLTAETAHGASEGDSTCYISQDSTDLNSFIAMDQTGSFSHNQSLYLPSGDYTYHFRCIDAGGNTAEDSTEFSVVVDTDGPNVARVYRDGSGLKVITSEAAECVYSLSTCNYNFEDGLPMLLENPIDKDVHFSEWDESKTYHIKCKDLQGNQPVPDQCNIVVQGSEL